MPDIRTGNVDIERMSEKEGIPIPEIESALGGPIEECTATTVEEAKVAYWVSSPCGSELERSAIRKIATFYTT